MEKLPSDGMNSQFPDINPEYLETIFKEISSQKNYQEGKFDEDIIKSMENFGGGYEEDTKDEYLVTSGSGSGAGGDDQDPDQFSTNNILINADDVKQDFCGNMMDHGNDLNQLERYPPPLVPPTTLQQNHHLNHSTLLPTIPPSSNRNVQSVGMIPANDNFPGDFNFELIINTAAKYNWVYSPNLNKVFINMGLPLPVQFRWAPCDIDLYVRATPLFANSQLAQEVVIRCLNHSSSTDNSNKDVPDYVHRHVIRCLQPQTQYLCTSGRYSILTPLGQPQPGTDTVRLTYTFMCKNSCSSGMNRRPLEIVYTLETIDGTILGRRRLEVRICSCPKRDKDKEEAELKGLNTKKRKIPQQQQSSSNNNNPQSHRSSKASRRTSNNLTGPSNDTQAGPIDEEQDDVSTHSLQLNVVGRGYAKKVLIAAYDAIIGEAVRQNEPLDLHQPCLDDIAKKIDDMSQ